MTTISRHVRISSSPYLGFSARTYGSTFATAIINKLTIESKNNPLIDLDDDDDLDFLDQKSQAYAEFEKIVYKTLRRDIDRHSGEDALILCTLSNAVSLKEVVRMFSTFAISYLKSYPGNDDTGNDGALHNLLWRIINGEETDYKKIISAYRVVNYRFTLMTMTDGYLELMDLPPPNDQNCSQYNVRKLRQEIGQRKFGILWTMIASRCTTLYPRPIVDEQGWPFDKGLEYLIAALHYTNVSEEDASRKLETLVEVVDRELEQKKAIIERDPEVRAKRQKLYQTFGTDLGSIIPMKRRSSSCL